MAAIFAGARVTCFTGTGAGRVLAEPPPARRVAEKLHNWAAGDGSRPPALPGWADAPAAPPAETLAGTPLASAPPTEGAESGAVATGAGKLATF